MERHKQGQVMRDGTTQTGAGGGLVTVVKGKPVATTQSMARSTCMRSVDPATDERVQEINPKDYKYMNCVTHKQAYSCAPKKTCPKKKDRI